MHPLTGQRLDLWRLKNFVGTRLPSAEDTYLMHLVAPNNPADERLVAMAEIRDANPARDANGVVIGFPAAERVLGACLDSIRRVQAARGSKSRLDKNRIFLHVWPPIELPLRDLTQFARNYAPLSVGAGLEEITVLATLQEPGQRARAIALRFTDAAGAGMTVKVTAPPTDPIVPLDNYTQKVQRSAARGLVYPYEIVPLLTGPERQLRPSTTSPRTGRSGRSIGPKGRNKAGVIVGVVVTPTDRYPEGMTRVAIFGDPTKALGTVAVAECALIVAAIDLAEAQGRAGGVVRAVLRRQDLDGLRHREHGRGGPGAAADHHVHPGRRRDQHRRRRNQRRCAAVLERRGDHAAAHQGCADHDPGQRDGAHRQALAGLLRWRLGRGQLRHRRIRPGDGPQR